MTESSGKYKAALSGVMQKDEKQNAIDVYLPRKERVLYGKRSNPEWGQKAVLLKTLSVEKATVRLKERRDGTDFSELLQALLEAWLDTPA